MREEGVDLWLLHLARLANIVEVNEPLDAVAIGLIGPGAVVPGPQCLVQLIQQLRFTADNRQAA